MTDAITQQSSLRIGAVIALAQSTGGLTFYPWGPLRLRLFVGLSRIRQLSIAMALLNITLAVFLRRAL